MGSERASEVSKTIQAPYALARSDVAPGMMRQQHIQNTPEPIPFACRNEKYPPRP